MQPHVQEAYHNHLHSLVQPSLSSPSFRVVNKILVSQDTHLDEKLQKVVARLGLDIGQIEIKCLKSCSVIELNKTNPSNNVVVVNLNPLALTKTMTIVLHTIHYHGDWKYPFDVKYHKWIKFWVDNHRYKLVSGMHFESVFPTAALCGLNIVALPYFGKNHLALLMAIPNTITGLRKELKRLSQRQAEILNVPFQWKAVNVDVPVFSIVNEPISNVALMEKVRMCIGLRSM